MSSNPLSLLTFGRLVPVRLFQDPEISGDIRAGEIIVNIRPKISFLDSQFSGDFVLFFNYCDRSEHILKRFSRYSQPLAPTPSRKMTSITAARPSLTSNDSAVLQALFDAESSPSSGFTVDPSLPPWPSSVNISETDLTSLKQRETDIIRKLQSDKSPSIETVQSALDDFDSLITGHPTYPSAYTNRAQTLRLLVDLIYSKEAGSDQSTEGEISDAALFAPQTSQLCSRIFSDLGQAITFATPASPADAVSTTQARLLADAHTHRGYLLLKAARMKKAGSSDEAGPERLRALSADQLEEMASRDFFFGGRYGNKVAQQLSVQTNPYAKMCGAIVKEAMKKELEG
jgi:hypothetical protein